MKCICAGGKLAVKEAATASKRVLNELNMLSGTKVRIISTLVEGWTSCVETQPPSTWQNLRWRLFLKQVFWRENPVSVVSRVYDDE